ncbi:MAG: lipid II flippase MurJ [Ignavibacteriaceae bacterium]
MKSKVITTIGKATVLLTLLTILSKIIGLFREMIYARNFGLTSQFDLFLVSAVIPIVINTSLVYLGQHYFIPAYNRAKLISEEEAKIFFRTTFWIFIFGQITGREIFLLLLITIPVNAGMFIIAAYLQANFRFVYPAITQIIMNIILITLIITFTDIFEIFVLPLAFLIAYSSAFIIIIIPVRKIVNFNFSTILSFKQKLTDIQIIVSLIFIEGLSLSYILIDRYFFGDIPPGSIAALNYALIIFALPVSIFSIPLITTFFSKFSKSSLNDNEQLEIDFKKAVKINIFILLPVSIVLLFWGDFFIQLFYQRGKFTAADTFLTHTILQYYAVSLVFFSSYLVIVKLLYSVNKYKNVLIISVIAFVLKIIFNFTFVNTWQQNGLALSTSLVYIFLFIIGSFLVVKILNIKNRYFLLVDILYFTINAIVSYSVSLIYSNAYSDHGIFGEISSLFVFIVVYIVNSILLSDEEFKIIKNSLNSFMVSKSSTG